MLSREIKERNQRQNSCLGRIVAVSMPYYGKMRMFEAGGSVLHPSNAYFTGWMEEFGMGIHFLSYFKQLSILACGNVTYLRCEFSKFDIFAAITQHILICFRHIEISSRDVFPLIKR